MFKDIRHNDFHKFEVGHTKWSTDWQKFPGFPYIPLVTELEEWVLSLYNDFHGFMQHNWHFSLYISMAYILLIFSLRKCMKRRVSFDLRQPMGYWNSLLAVFSIIGVIRCLPEFVHILAHKGFDASIRDSSYYLDVRLNMWYLFFIVSKSFELVDTLFIILRKHKLLTLHWVHHCLTLCYSWYVFGDIPVIARWMVNMNLMIHSLMYSYYACKAFRINIPRAVNISITSLQILQMLFGLWINIRVVQLKLTEQPCDSHISVGVTGLLLYTVFFILFVNFFVRSYLLKPATKTMVFSSSTVGHQRSQLHTKNVLKMGTTQKRNGFSGHNNNDSKKYL